MARRFVTARRWLHEDVIRADLDLAFKVRWLKRDDCNGPYLLQSERSKLPLDTEIEQLQLVTAVSLRLAGNCKLPLYTETKRSPTQVNITDDQNPKLETENPNPESQNCDCHNKHTQKHTHTHTHPFRPLAHTSAPCASRTDWWNTGASRVHRPCPRVPSNDREKGARKRHAALRDALRARYLPQYLAKCFSRAVAQHNENQTHKA